jgi:hypothetical protein
VTRGTVSAPQLDCYSFPVFRRSELATIGLFSYLLAFLAAFFYPYISRQTFAGLPAVMLAWPWIDLLHPKSRLALLACAALNAAIIYAALALLSAALRRVLSRPH